MLFLAISWAHGGSCGGSEMRGKLFDNICTIFFRPGDSKKRAVYLMLTC